MNITLFKSHYQIILIIILGTALYANTLPNALFWDDDDFILNNAYIKDWRYLERYFSENVIAGAGLLSNYWRPLLLMVFAAEWSLFGGWAPGYHFTNAVFHITDAILLFLLLRLIFKNKTLSFLTALIFLAHPLQTEAVAYANGLGDSLSVFFVLGGLLFYLKRHLKFSLLFYGLALMSKETAIVMPGIVFILEWFRSGGFRKMRIKSVLAFASVAITYILLRATALNFSNIFNFYDGDNVFASSFFVRLATFFRVLTVYVRLLFLPLQLQMERSVEMAKDLFSGSVMLGGAILAFLLFVSASALFFRKWRIAGFGSMWFLIAIFPVSNLAVPINGLLYEHWLYFPMIGIFLPLIWLGLRLARRYRMISRFLAAGFAVLIAVFSGFTVRRNAEWRDPIVFYEKTLKYAPGSYRVINNLGMSYALKGFFDEAKVRYEKAIGLDPQNPVAYHNLGNLYRAEGKNKEAVDNFRKAIALNEKFFFSYNALISIYAENKKYDEVEKLIKVYQEASVRP